MAIEMIAIQLKYKKLEEINVVIVICTYKQMTRTYLSFYKNRYAYMHICIYVICIYMKYR